MPGFDGFLRARLDELDPEEQRLLAGARAVADQHLAQCAEGGVCATCRVPHPCPTLRLLAWPFENHPDYDEAWSVPG